MADPTPDAPGLGVFVAREKRMQKRLAAVEAPTGTQRFQAVQKLQESIDALPLQVMEVQDASGIALSAGWVSYATVSLTVPPEKRRLQVLAIGTAAVLDQLSGGVTSSYGRIRINGELSREFPAAKDAGATVVNNVITATSARAVDVTELDTVEIRFELQPLNPSAFPANPANFAQLAVHGSFTIS